MAVSPGTFTESVVGQAALAWLERAGWQARNGAESAPGEPTADCEDDENLVLATRLREALAPHRIPPSLILGAYVASQAASVKLATLKFALPVTVDSVLFFQ